MNWITLFQVDKKIHTLSLDHVTKYMSNQGGDGKHRSSNSNAEKRNCKAPLSCLEEFHHFNWDRKEVVDRKSKYIPGKWKNLCVCWGILITLKKFNTRKYVFLTYGSSQLLLYFTPVDSDWWNLRKLVTFASVKRINLISLIIQIAQLLPSQLSSSTMLFSFRFTYFL